MIRTQIQLTEEQARKLRRAAREHGISIAQVVRRCIDRAIDQDLSTRERYARAARLVGKYKDRKGAADVSTAHDDYLDQAFE